MNDEKKKILCIDFDGVIHSYKSGWKGPDIIPDPPVPGALDFLLEAAKHFEVHILSARSGFIEGRYAMRIWLREALIEHGIGSERACHVVDFVINWPTDKPPAHVTIDDRAVCFSGWFPSIKTLVEFKPWYQLSKENPNNDND